LPLGLLVPRLQINPPEGVALGVLILASPLVGGCQAGEHLQDLALQLLLLQERPFFKGGRIADRKAFQETAPVQSDSLLQTRQVFCQACDGFNVQPIVAVCVELEGLPCCVEVRRRRPVIANGLSHVRQGTAQVRSSRRLRVVGP
jgi:hypothetical protein